MKNTLKRIGISALLGFLSVLPFAILEVVNRREFHEEFPFVLFIGMWGIQVVFFLALLSIIQKIKVGENNLTRMVSLLFGIAILLLAAWFWISLLHDQMPCFLGVRYCD
jgi:drug/metabolite transporter (DMT)-like permease